MSYWRILGGSAYKRYLVGPPWTLENFNEMLLLQCGRSQILVARRCRHADFPRIKCLIRVVFRTRCFIGQQLLTEQVLHYRTGDAKFCRICVKLTLDVCILLVR
jgi:hypothetical protein